MRLVFLGPPGSGKGTQAERIALRHGCPHISTGTMLRAAITSGTELGGRVEKIVAGGNLVDDATMREVVRLRLADDDTRGGFVLDGYPRTLVQTEDLKRILAHRGEQLDVVLCLELSEDELRRRLFCRGRDDDTDATVQNRIRVYGRQTAPLLEHYSKRGLLVLVDGEGTVDEITDRLVAVLRPV